MYMSSLILEMGLSSINKFYKLHIIEDKEQVWESNLISGEEIVHCVSINVMQRLPYPTRFNIKRILKKISSIWGGKVTKLPNQ